MELMESKKPLVERLEFDIRTEDADGKVVVYGPMAM
jgi:hypothetical protein